MFSAYIVHSEFTGNIDIGQRQQNPVMNSIADSQNETVSSTEEISAFDPILLTIYAIAILLVAASIYLIGRHI